MKRIVTGLTLSPLRDILLNVGSLGGFYVGLWRMMMTVSRDDVLGPNDRVSVCGFSYS
jgi:hypothetical protein